MLDKFPTRLREQRWIINLRFDELRPILNGAPIVRGREARRDRDHCEYHAAASADHTPTGLENRALSPEAA